MTNGLKPEEKNIVNNDGQQSIENEKTEITKENKIETQAKPELSQQVEAKSAKNETDSYSAWMIAAGLILLAALGYSYFKKRKK